MATSKASSNGKGKGTKAAPITNIKGTFAKPKPKGGTPLTPKQRTAMLKARAIKAAATRGNARYRINLQGGGTAIINGSQLAGMRANAKRTAAQRKAAAAKAARTRANGKGKGKAKAAKA